MTRRDKLIVVALVALLAVASVAAIVSEAGEGPPLPAYGGAYVEGVAGVPVYLNPLIAATSLDQDVAQLVFSGLTRRDRDGVIVADLASAFRAEGDGKVWTFDLRADAIWHDGAEVTSDDVLYTVGLLQDPAYVGPYADAFRGVKVDKLGWKTIRFTLSDVYGPFVESTTVPLLPAHLLAKVSFAELARQPFNLRPVGTGPFRVTEVDQRQVVLLRTEGFYRVMPQRTRPYLDRVVLRYFREPSDALAALARGEVDGVAGLAPTDAGRARTLPAVSLYSLPTNDLSAIFLNLRPEKAVFRDRVVRQAIATAIDRARVLQVAADGRGTLADEVVPPTSWAFVKDVSRYPHSAAEARAMLDAADWKDHDGDGVRDKAGVALSFSLTTTDEPERIASGLQVVEDLRAIGMRVELLTTPFGQVVDTVARQRTFDALLIGMSRRGDPDPYEFFHSSQARDPGHNFSGYSTLPMDRSLEAARRTFDQTKRRDLYVTVFQQIASEVPMIPLYFADYLYVQNRAVQGLRIAAIDDPPKRFWNIEDWYVRTAPKR